MAIHTSFNATLANSGKFNVLIYGSGAVGSILGWRLAQQSNVKVSLVCRSNYDVVKQSGFTFETTKWGNGTLEPHHVYHVDDLCWNPPTDRFDYIVCSNKVSHESFPAIIEDLRRIAHADTTFVSAQNGMDVELPLKQAFPNNTVLSAICNVGCAQSRAGFVQQRASLNKPAFQIGLYNHNTKTATDLIKRDALVACDSKFGSADDIVQHRWKKLLFNGVWNATTALTNLNTHEVLADSDALDLAKSISEEATQIAIAADAELDNNYSEELIKMARTSDSLTPSTLQDARIGRVMEIDSIWGYLVDKATELDVSADTLQQVYDLLQFMNASFLQQRDAIPIPV